MSKNLDEIERLKSEEIQEVKRERQEETGKGRSCAPHLAISSVASLPGRNDYLEICCLVVKNEIKKIVSARFARKLEVRGKDGEGLYGENGAKVREEEKRNGKLVGASETKGEIAK